MTEAEITSQVTAWIAKTCQPRFGEVDVSDDTKLLEIGYLDSLQTMDLIFFLEELLGLKIPIQELTSENFETPLTVTAMAQRAQSAMGKFK